MIRIEHDEVCPSCGGTGLYQGMAEKDGFAVVCSKCHGSGKYRFVHEYEPFVERKPKRGVLRVLQTNPGFCVGTQGKDQEFAIDHFGGMPFEDWQSGKPFPIGSEMRQSCPRWWWQCTGAKREAEPRTEDFGCDWGMFSNCKNYANRAVCWAKWDKQRLVAP